MKELLKTPLNMNHISLGAKMVDFGGWEMPLSYTSVIEEHKTVRESCGLFDVSHMGEILVTGKDAEEFLNYLTINDVSQLKSGFGQYTALLNHNGGILDDLILYRLTDQKYLLCINASNSKKIYEWICENNTTEEIECQNQSPAFAQFAIQGPNSFEALSNIISEDIHRFAAELAYTQIVELPFGERAAYLARTGYTGEKGYELYLPSEIASSVWDQMLTGNVAVSPIGLGARDTLRLEACYLLYGNDINEKTTPLEAGIAWATKLDKKNFIGKDSLLADKKAGINRKLVAFKLEDKGVARSGMDVYIEGDRVGIVTSGSVLPTLGGSGGLAMIEISRSDIDTGLEIDIRGKMKSARIVKKPMYTAKTRK